MNWKRIFFWRKKVDVQDVFNRVIDAGFYGSGTTYSGWMCWSLAEALREGVISPEERHEAKKAILKYVGTSRCTLQNVLDLNGLPSSYRHRLKIYRDWANRPKLKNK